MLGCNKDGPEEGCPSGKKIGQVAQWYHPGKDPDLFLRVATAEITVKPVTRQEWI